MIDDGREIQRNRDFGELRSGCSVGTGLRGASDTSVITDATNSGRPSARRARAHERFVGGDRGRSFRHVVGDLAFGEGVERDLLAQVVQAQLMP